MGKIELPPRRQPLYEAVSKGGTATTAISTPLRVTKSVPRAEPAAVNATPVVNRPAVNGAVNKRGAYPATDTRRAYMRAYMQKRRTGHAVV